MENKTECAVCHDVLVVDILKVTDNGKPSVQTMTKTIAVHEVWGCTDCVVRHCYCLTCGLLYKYTPSVMTGKPV